MIAENLADPILQPVQSFLLATKEGDSMTA